jgi:hypothetical protein
MSAAERHGDAVWVELDNAGPSGCTLMDLVTLTGLSRAQAKAGLGHINHILQEDRSQPIVVVHRGLACYYILPEHYAEAEEWLRNRGRDLRTRLLTERSRGVAAFAKWPNEAARIERDMTRTIEDLEDVLLKIGA